MLFRSVEGILKEIIPNYSNDLIHKTHESSFELITEDEKPTYMSDEVVSGMEFSLSKDSQKSDFQIELAKHIEMIKDLMGKKNKEEDPKLDEE